ncbi:MAG TPA: AI-2E family transporter [Pyrinomonadaceae bacterium]|nr:AI-2E family transporter [Pyrinomonadaceae bacterium]
MPRRDDSRRLSELTVGDAKRIVVYGAAVLLAVWLFFLLVGHVLVALLLGVVAAAYLLPVQEWLERRLRARAGSALITIALIVVPLVSIIGYAWYEMSDYSRLVEQKRGEIIEGISRVVTTYVPVSRQGTRAGLERVFAEAVTRSASAIRELHQRAALLLASLAVFFFTLFYVLTQRARISNYVKVRVPGDFLELYERLSENVGAALRGALQAVFVDQAIKGVVIFVLNLVFGVPLALVLGLVTFIIGFFPVLGEWGVYIPVSVYLLVFRHDTTGALFYFLIGVGLTIASTLVIRPRLAASGARGFNFYWMLVALVAGVYAFGIPGIVLGPAILGFVKAVADTVTGNVRYETSLLKEEKDQQAGRDEEIARAQEGARAEALDRA